MSKNKMAAELGYEYLGKGFDDAGDEGFIVRKHGSTNTRIIGYNMEQATTWLEMKLEEKRENEQ